MPKTVEIKCDTCERDLTSTGNCEDYRIALLNQSISSRGGLVTLMALWPALESDMYFCGEFCLLKWAQIRIDQNRIAREKHQRTPGFVLADGELKWERPDGLPLEPGQEAPIGIGQS